MLQIWKFCYISLDLHNLHYIAYDNKKQGLSLKSGGWVISTTPRYQERFGFPAECFSSLLRFRRGGLDRAKMKYLLKIFWPPPQYIKTFIFRIFARKRTQSVWRILPHPKFAKHEKPNRTAALPLSERPSERGVSPSPSEGERCIRHKRSPPKRAVHSHCGEASH